MNYQEFITTTKQSIEERLGDDVHIELQSIPKNNGMILDALVIMRSGINISPTIYLNPYYHRYLDGVTLEDIYDDIVCVYHDHMPSHNIDVSFFTDFSQVKDRIIYKLINYEQNKELLKTIPHYRILDFAIIFNCLLNSSKEDYATILIHNHHLGYWGIQKEELYSLAKENTPLLLPSQIENMMDIIQNMIDFPIDCSMKGPYEMYVLSNKPRINGASVLLYDGLLLSIANRFQKDLLILPSSIHETILVPFDDIDNFDSFSNMVHEVNQTQLADDEILSDHVYVFLRENGMLSIPAQFSIAN